MPHNSQKISPRFLLCWLTALLLEFPFIASLAMQNSVYLETNLRTALAIHALSAITLFFAFPKGEGWLHRRRNWAILFFFMVLFLPVFGVISSLVLFSMHKHNPDPSKIFDEDPAFFKTQEPAPADQPGPKISWEQKASEAIDILPLGDILLGNDINLKRGAIEKLTLDASPSAIKLLLDHSADPSPEVRFYITSSLTRIKKSIDEKLEAARVEMKKNVYKISARVFLAKIYIRYAKSNLLDETTSEQCIKEAIYHLKYAIDSEQAGESAYRTLIEIYTEQGNWEGVFETVLAMEKKNLMSLTEITKIKLNYYYNTRQFKIFTKELGHLFKLKDVEPEWLATANWWGANLG